MAKRIIIEYERNQISNKGDALSSSDKLKISMNKLKLLYSRGKLQQALNYIDSISSDSSKKRPKHP